MSSRIEACILQDYKRGVSLEILTQVYATSLHTIVKIVHKYLVMRTK